MFKFLKRVGRSAPQLETQRQIVERAVGEINAILENMETKPTIATDLNTGRLEISLPDQMPDEALALPAPNEAPQADPDADDKSRVEELPTADDAQVETGSNESDAKG